MADQSQRRLALSQNYGGLLSCQRTTRSRRRRKKSEKKLEKLM